MMMKGIIKIKRSLKVIFGIVITVAALFFGAKALEGLDPAKLLSAQINWWLIALSALIFTFSTIFRSLVYTLGIDPNMNFLEAWRIVAIGNAANMILPFRSGEGLRLALFPKSYTIIERTELTIIPGITDMVVILLLCIVAVYTSDFKNQYYVTIVKIAGFVFLGACALAISISICIPKLRLQITKILSRKFFRMFVWVILSWTAVLISIWVGFLALGYSSVRSAELIPGAFIGMNLIMFVPSSPGGIGLFEYSVVMGLGGLGVAPLSAKTAGLMLHVIQYITLLPLGAILYLTTFIGKNKKQLIFSHTRATRKLL